MFLLPIELHSGFGGKELHSGSGGKESVLFKFQAEILPVLKVIELINEDFVRQGLFYL